jgi:hypothetical protein
VRRILPLLIREKFMGLAFAAGRAWGRMGPRGKLASVAAMAFLFALPYVAFKYDEYSTARTAEAEKRASAERVRKRIEAEQVRVAALTPEQREAEQVAAAKRADEAKEHAAALARAQADADASKAKRDLQLRMAVAAARQLRSSMKDPEAFVLTDAALLPSGAACYSYRAKNSFGATLPSAAMLHTNGKLLLQERDGNAFVAAWNKECAKAGGEKITSFVKGNL